jgi:uncharacterized protein (DUF2267 family)
MVDGITAAATAMHEGLLRNAKAITEAWYSAAQLPNFPKGTAMATTPDHLDRVYTKYGDEKPYTDQDTLQQKLWSVVDREVGPNEADLVTSKLVQAVEEHITKVGVRR